MKTSLRKIITSILIQQKLNVILRTVFTIIMGLKEYMKEKTFFVDQGTSFMHVHRVCPICENKTFVGRPKAMLRKSEVTELHRLLDSGLPDTKTWLRSLPEKQMDKVLERYYSLEAFEFMRRILQ